MDVDVDVDVGVDVDVLISEERKFVCIVDDVVVDDVDDVEVDVEMVDERLGAVVPVLSD